MKNTTIILMGLAMVAGASLRARREGKSKWFPHLSGSQKIFGLVAFALALLILLNPELLALGFLGDTAFFDVLVLALSLQMHTYVMRVARAGASGLRRAMRWAGIPSPGLCYSIAVATVMIADFVSLLQKAAHLRQEGS